MSFKALIDRVKRYLLHLRLQPIRVLCFHIVCDTFDKETMWECDWMSVDGFKKLITELLSKYRFISLEKAYSHLRDDRVRFRKYVVITFDDGHSSIRNVMPWLAMNEIPVTLFVNSGILSNECSREKPMHLLTADELHKMEAQYGKILSIANHGYTHESCTDIPLDVFMKGVLISEAYLSQFKSRIPFFAYPFGHYSLQKNDCLRSLHLVPVLCDGMKNYNDYESIHREVI